MKKLGLLFSFFSSLASASNTEGLARTLWTCNIPCHSKRNHALTGHVQFSYCSTNVLSPEMLDLVDPLCQEKSRRKDVEAARMSRASVANCISSSNTCAKEGFARSGWMCSFVCPSEGSLVRKFTACAVTDREAWSHAKQLCADATPPDAAYFPPSHLCMPEGQTPCE